MTTLHKKLKHKRESPHISRTISALLFPLGNKVVLWLGIATLIFINVQSIQKTEITTIRNSSVLLSPKSPEPHIVLAQAYWQNHLFGDARRELALADELYSLSTSQNSGNTLGVTTLPSSLLARWEREPQGLRIQYEFWQSVVAQRPDYRDAYLTLAAIAYELSQLEKAREYLREAMRLDPNALLGNTLVSQLKDESN